MAKSTAKKTSAKSVDRDTAADHAAAKHKQETGMDVGTDNARARAKAHGEVEPKQHKGETITQHKRSISDDGLDPGTMESVGKGSITEEVPAVRAQEAREDGAGKVVQQGADVILHSHNPINGQTDVSGKILKVNGDGSVAVRVDLGNGETRDFTGVKPSKSEDTNPWFELAA